MATLRGNMSQLLVPGIHQTYFEWLPEHPEEYSQFLKVETSDREHEQEQIFGGIGLARIKPEGTPITYQDPVQGGSKRYTHDTFALAFQVTEEMMDDDKYGIIRKIPQELMKAMRQRVEQKGAEPLNTGTTTTLTADGATLFSTSHPLLNPSIGTVTTATQSNRLNPASDMTATAIQNLMLMAESQVSETGMKVRLSPTDVWFHPDLQFVAQRLFGSQFDPDTGTNAINTVAGRLNPHVLHYITSTTFWAVSSREQNTMKFFWRKRPVTDSTDDFETKSAKYSLHSRFTSGVTDYRGWWLGRT